MASITLDNGRVLGDYAEPYVVAELNTSHFGDLALARSMIDKAREVGCDCVKFQSWSAQTLYAQSYYRQRGNAITRRFVDKLSLDDGQLQALADHCHEVGIDFASTPYSVREARFLVERCRVPFIKIASMELDNLPYLEQLGRLGAPLVLSTGMGTLQEIVRAVRTIEATGHRRLAILHCISSYPVPAENTRLHNILGLRSEFPQYPIGYSDHSLGSEVPVAAVALGACLIEKHFTLDATRIGMDNQMATEPAAMREMVEQCRRVHKAMGGSGRLLDAAEREMIPRMRRSLITTRALPAGHVLGEQDLDAKRPGTGIPPCDLGRVVGRRLRVALDAEDLIQPGHLED